MEVSPIVYFRSLDSNEIEYLDRDLEDFFSSVQTEM